MSLGKAIRENRKRLGLTQEGLADRLKVERPTISTWERDKNQPTKDNLIALATVFEITLDELVGPAKAKSLLEGPATFISPEPSNGKILPLDSLTWIPVISPEVKVSAGPGNCCEEVIWEKIDDFPLFDGKIAALYSDNGLLSIYVEGNSMEPQIHDGDLVIFRKSSDWVSGNVVVVCLDGRLLVKGIVRGPDGGVRLRSLNKNYDDILIGERSFFLVYGRVIKIIRQLDPKPVL